MIPHRHVIALALLMGLTLSPGGAAQEQPATAPKLDPKWLPFVRDDQPFGKGPAQEMQAFNQAVLFAHRTPLKSFEAGAVAFDPAPLLADPAAHRGQVVTVQGTLLRLSREEAPA